MIRYPEGFDPISEYWSKIQSGEEVVSAKVRKIYRHLADKIAAATDAGRWIDPAEREWHYDSRRAAHVVEFAENFCHHSKGKEGGKPVRLELWEKAMLAAMFGFVDIEGCRQYQQVILIVGKKNGKSLLASVVGDYMLTADGEAGPEVYAVATKRDQAKIIWAEAKRMVKKSPALCKRVRTLVGELVYDGNDGSFKPLASDSNSLDGLNVHCALMDEIHQWQNGRALFDIIADGTTAREQPLIFITSTAGVIREDIYDEKYEEAERVLNGLNDPEGYHDPRFLPFVYELDARSEWVDESCWKKANPGLGTIKSLRQLREKVERAKADSSLVRNLVCKEFNIRETSSEAWLTFEELNNEDQISLDPAARRFLWTPKGGEPRELPYPRYGIGGVDLSSTTDLTAAKVLFEVPGCDKLFAIGMYWIAEELVEKKVREDKIPYDKWIARGLCRTCAGNSVSYRDVKAWFVEVQEQLDIYLPWIGYDAWSAKYFVEDMAGYFGQSCMVPVRQGKQTLSDPMKRLGNDLASKRMVYGGGPIDKWCLTNTSYDEDKNGNIQPHKTSRSTRRIDGVAALLDAYVVYQDRQADYRNMI